MKYFVGQTWPSLRWRVVMVDDIQGNAIRERGTGHVYGSPEQAHAVADKLNDGRDQKYGRENEEA